jgi:hypothetical protein
MEQDDPIAELVFLARAAAEAGLDWHERLHHEWLPRTVKSRQRASLAAALAEWQGETPTLDADLTDAVESAVVDALAQEGYY